MPANCTRRFRPEAAAHARARRRTLTIVKPSISGSPRFCKRCSYMPATLLYALIAGVASLDERSVDAP